MTRDTRRSHTAIAIAAATLICIAGCDRQPSNGSGASSSTPTPAPAAATSSGSTMSVAGVAFTLPEGWTQAPPSNSMRLAEIHAPGDPTPCVAAFSSAGGAVDANIARWVMQMTDASGAPLPTPDVQTRDAAGLKIHSVEMRGTYLGMRMSPPEPDTIMRAAIIETPSGMLFIKMTGSAASMEPLADAWDSMLDSAHPG